MAEDQPPPSYNDTTSVTPQLTLRSPPPSVRPQPGSPITSHYINVVPHAAPTSFPYPEPSQLWLSRDVRKEDWASFVANLLAVPDPAAPPDDNLDHKDKLPGPPKDATPSDPPPPANRDPDVLQRMHAVLAEWNEGFFKPRGLKIVAAGEGDTSTSETRKSPSDKGWKFGPDKFGFQVGNMLIGLDTASASSSKQAVGSSSGAHTKADFEKK